MTTPSQAQAVDALIDTLLHAVPYAMEQLAKRSGPTDAELRDAADLLLLETPEERAAGTILDPDAFAGEDVETDNQRREFAWAVATLAFRPGGIQLFGRGYCAAHARYGVPQDEATCPECAKPAPRLIHAMGLKGVRRG